MVAVNAFPFAAICIVVMVGPRGQNAKVIYEAFFEAEEYLPLLSMHFASPLSLELLDVTVSPEVSNESRRRT